MPCRLGSPQQVGRPASFLPDEKRNQNFSEDPDRGTPWSEGPALMQLARPASFCRTKNGNLILAKDPAPGAPLTWDQAGCQAHGFYSKTPAHSVFVRVYSPPIFHSTRGKSRHSNPRCA